MILWTFFPRRTLGRSQKPINILNIKYITDIKTPMTNLEAERNPLISLNKKCSRRDCYSKKLVEIRASNLELSDEGCN
jgi:hypothetical protein